MNLLREFKCYSKSRVLHMTTSITDHIKMLQITIFYLFQLMNRGFAMLTTVPLWETHTMYIMEDLVKILLDYV
jgi:hypothetical protein